MPLPVCLLLPLCLSACARRRRGLVSRAAIFFRVLRPLACRVRCGCLRRPLFSPSPRASLARGNFPLGLAQLLLAAFYCRSDRSGLVSREAGKQRFFRIFFGNFGENVSGGQITGPLSARFRLGFGSASVLFSEISVRVSQAAKLPVRFRLAFGSLSARFRLGFGSLLVRFWFGFGSVSARFWLGFGSLSCTEPSQVHFWFTFGSLLLGADRCRFTFGSLSARSWLSFGPSGSSFGSLSVRFRLAFGSLSARFWNTFRSAGHFSSKFSFLIQNFQHRAFDSLFARRN